MKAFYHLADLDGHCSGAIVKMAYPDCEMIGINYGDDFPWADIKQEEIVYMVDFSLQPFKDMIKLFNSCELVWIDHHKTAIEEYKKYSDIVKLDWCGMRDIKKAGCELCWEYFNLEKPYPEVVRLLGRYDVWDLGERILSFQFGMRLNEWNPNENCWNNLLNNDLNMIANIEERGGVVRTYKKQQDKQIMDKFSYEIEWEGYKCLVCNINIFNSQTFKSKWDKKKYDIMIGYASVKGEYYTVSIYTDKKGIDGSIIAKKYGGGGHAQASGFQCKELPWIK